MNYISSYSRMSNIKLNLDVLLIFVFIIFSLSEGIVSKLIQAFILFIMFKRTNNSIPLESRMKYRLLLFAPLPVAFLLIQIIFLKLNFGEILYLVGITKNLYIGIVIFLVARNYFRKIDNFILALSLFLIYLNIGALFTVLLNFSSVDSRVSFLSFASMNYTTALSTISIPIYFYYFSNFKSKNKWGINILNNITILLSLIAIIVSGSRANMLFLVIEIFVIFFLIKKDIKFFLKTITVFIFSFFLITNILHSFNSKIYELFLRGFSVFESVEDSSRDLLWAASEIQFEFSNKFIGSGSVIVQYYQKEAHNFIWELLLYGGILGIGLYVIYVFLFTLLLFRKIRIIDKIYILLTFIIAYGIGYVQPFVTTGYSFNILLWSSVILMSFSGRMKKINE